MSYSSILKALPEALRHPAGMAMISSFAFHGLLFAGAPLLPGSSQAISSERLVRLIQLSPAERSRLPQVSSSTTPLPPVPPSDLSSLVLPPLSELPDFSNQPNLGSLNPPSSGSAPSIDISPGQPLPSGPPISIPKPVERPATLPPPPNSNTLPSFEPQIPNVSDAPPINFPDNGSSLPPGTDPANSPEVGTPESLNRWIASAREVSGDSKLEFQNTTIPFTYPEAACKDRAEGLAFVGVLVRPNGGQAQEPQLLGDSGNETLNDAAVTAVKNHRFGPTGQYQAFLPSFEYKYSEEACSEKTTPSPTPEASPSPNQSPTNSPNTPSSSQPTPQKISITSVYPKAACVDRLEGSTSVAATVKPNSQRAENIKLLSSSDHQALDQAAVEVAKGSKFNPTGQEQNLVLDFQFRYSEAACPKETTSPSSSSTEDSEGDTPKSSQESPSSSKRSQESQSPSSQKSSQPAQESPSSEEPASESSDSEEPASESSSGSSEEPTQESSDSEKTTAP